MNAENLALSVWHTRTCPSIFLLEIPAGRANPSYSQVPGARPCLSTSRSGVSGPTCVFSSKERGSLLQRTASVAPHCHLLDISAMPSRQGKVGFPLWAGHLGSAHYSAPGSLLNKDLSVMNVSKITCGWLAETQRFKLWGINPELVSWLRGCSWIPKGRRAEPGLCSSFCPQDNNIPCSHPMSGWSALPASSWGQGPPPFGFLPSTKPSPQLESQLGRPEGLTGKSEVLCTGRPNS